MIPSFSRLGGRRFGDGVLGRRVFGGGFDRGRSASAAERARLRRVGRQRALHRVADLHERAFRARDGALDQDEAALGVDGGAPRLVAIDGSPLLPSSVFRTDDGTLAVGRDADRQARLDPTRYEPNPKRRIDDGELLLGDAAVPVVSTIAAVLRLQNALIHAREGANDGIVGTESARWTGFEGIVEADHMAQIGLPGGRARRGFRSHDFLLDLVRRLADDEMAHQTAAR